MGEILKNYSPDSLGQFRPEFAQPSLCEGDPMFKNMVPFNSQKGDYYDFFPLLKTLWYCIIIALSNRVHLSGEQRGPRTPCFECCRLLC